MHRSRGAMHHLDAAQAGRFKPRGKVASHSFSGHRNRQRAPALALGKSQIQIGARSQRSDREALRITLNDREGAGSDGTGRTEDADVLQRKLTRWKYS